MKWYDIKYLLAYLVPFTGYLAVTKEGIWTYSAVIFAFGIIPVIEAFATRSTRNLGPAERAEKARSPFFDVLLYLNIPLVYLLVYLTLQRFSSGSLLSTSEVIGMILSVGIVLGASGINVAHELGHKTGKIPQLAACVLLLPSLYLHFFVEHNRGHHRNVGTPDDPATSRLNEPVYTFWIRSITQSYIHAWQLEADRMLKLVKPVISFSNQMVLFTLISIAYVMGVYVGYGLVGLFVAISIGGVSILLLETINYIEHYGLMRRKLANGQYENVEVFHSWNSNHELGRIILYELTRHSDHHFRAYKKYQILDHYDESPQLPLGYPTSMLLSFVPPLWYRKMNPLVSEALCRS